MTIDEFFANIPEGLENQEECKALPHNYMVMDFYKNKYGDAWTDNIDCCLMKDIVKKNMMNELIEFMNSYDKMSPELKEKTLKYFEHISKKTSMGLNWYGLDCCYYKEHFPAIQFKSITTTIHPSGERMCNVREYLELMGMPHDFEWFGDKGNWPKIGQNVPVKTAKFVTEQAIKVIQNWTNDARQDGSVIFFDNTNNNIKKIA
jgi:site-specific DNA-cytosine methylase